jgi:hypothetical protein
MRPSRTLLVLLVIPLLARDASGWGVTGHEAVNRCAADALPESAPAWLRRAAQRIEHLAYEPDRWRQTDLIPLDRSHAPDHYINVELSGDPAKLPEDRYAYFRQLVERQQKGELPAKLPPEIIGFVPYRAVELCELLEAQVAALEATPPATPAAHEAEEACIVTAGLLGHYVGDIANPHHTTMHYDGWRGENPRGYRTKRGFHSEFEEAFVDRVIDRKRVRELMTDVAPVASYRTTVVLHLKRSNGLVERLFELERRGGIPLVDPEKVAQHQPTDAERDAVEFLHERLASGASTLRDLWLTAVARGKERAERIRVATILAEELEKLGFDQGYVAHKPGRVLVLKGEISDELTIGYMVEMAKKIAEEKHLHVTIESELRVKGVEGPL